MPDYLTVPVAKRWARILRSAADFYELASEEDLEDGAYEIHEETRALSSELIAEYSRHFKELRELREKVM